jgi:uncharacterized membrane protein YkoI
MYFPLVILFPGLLSGQPGCHRPAGQLEPIRQQAPPSTAPDPGDGPNRVGIIVDIDETISITDYPSLFFGIGTDESRPYEYAQDVLTKLSQQFHLMYLTARPQWLTGETRKWLTERGFPPGTVLTTARMLDVYWPGSFKKRAVATLRHTSPNLLIGIGDRSTDVAAYVANGMLAMVVNPRRSTVYHERAVVLKRWRDVGVFFEQHAATLRDPNALKARYSIGGAPLDPTSVRTRPEVDLSLLVELPLLGPTLLIEGIAKIELAHEQAEARHALEQVKTPFAEVLQKVVARLDQDTLLKLRVATENNATVYVATFLRDGKVYEIELDPALEVTKEAEKVAVLLDKPLEALTRARLTFTQALARSLKEVEGHVYEIELEMDDNRPTYEIAVMALSRFMEVEIDAQTGEVIEVEDETATE